MLNELAAEVHGIAVEKGWYDTPRSFPELIALMHSELSEALEAWRERDVAITTEGNKPEGYGVEMADCIIRILDCCDYMGIDIDQAITRKIAYNRTRPYRHGGKRA